MRSLEAQLEAAWRHEQWRDVGVLVAVSGGPDSVALLRALLALAGGDPTNLAVGHFNHRLRGVESDADEQFVAELAARWNLPVVTQRSGDPRTEAEVSAGGTEAGARQQRYRFLLAAAQQRGARFVATGHTADDQVETVLHRILRGTGISGLAGMPRVRPLSEATVLIRPLLGTRRAEVLAYLEELGQDYRVDATNSELDFTRNRLRNDLLPKLEREYNAQVAEAILRLSRLASETQETIDRAVAELLAATIRSTGTAPGQVAIDCRGLRDKTRHLVRELLIRVWRQQQWPEQAMGLEQWERLADLCLGDGSARAASLPGKVHARRDGQTLFLTPES